MLKPLVLMCLLSSGVFGQRLPRDLLCFMYALEPYLVQR